MSTSSSRIKTLAAPALALARSLASSLASSLAGSLIFATAAHATGTVQVDFVEPAKYADAGHGTRDIERTTQALGDYLKSLGKKLPDGQVLSVAVTDIDLAGELRPTRNGNEVRVVRGRADWPSMKMRWTLTQDGRSIKSAEDKLADMNYTNSTVALRSSEPFIFERHMIDRWFSEQVTGTAAAR